MLLDFMYLGHPDEHLPGEGSGQDPEGHDGSTNTTAEKADKEPGKEEDLKNTTSVLPTGPPSEGQPSSNLVIVPTSSSSLRESMTENGLDYQSPMTSHQLTQVAVSVSTSLSLVTNISITDIFTISALLSNYFSQDCFQKHQLLGTHIFLEVFPDGHKSSNSSLLRFALVLNQL